MSADLLDLVAVVTGGGSGIGAACARELAARGARVVVADRSEVDAKEVAADIGKAARFVRADVTDPDDTDAMVAAAVDAFGRLDIAVNSAGVGSGGHFDVADLSFDRWRSVLAVNLDGVFLSMRSEIPALLASGGGSIVNVASVMASVAQAGASSYVASKHAVVGLTKAAALEYATRGIRVNAVGPGYIATPLLSRRDEEQLAELAGRHPVGRLGEAAEVAAVIGFLASPSSSFVTGAYYPVDGGYLVR